VIDSDFTNVTNVETLTAASNINLIATIGASALAAGIVTVETTDTGAADNITVAAGYTGTLTVDLASDAIAGNTVSASATAGTLIVTAADDELDSNASTLTGGTGTSDELKVTMTSGNDTILMTSITAIEKLTTAGA